MVSSTNDYVIRDVHMSWNVDDLSDNILAKRIHQKCTWDRIKWSTNYPMNSSANAEGSELKNVTKFPANYKLVLAKHRWTNM